MQIKWGIIGCGDVTEVKSGPAFQKVQNSSLVAVMRRNGDKASDYARRHNVPKWYDDAQALINDPEVNAVYVATPPSSHEQYAIDAMTAGKPVYLEKPMALDAAAADRIGAFAARSGMKLSVAHYRRAQPIFQKVRELLATKRIGTPLSISMTMHQPHMSNLIAQTEEAWRTDPAISGGGLFHDLAPHQLDLMNYFFGAPEKLQGRAWNEGGFYGVPDNVEAQIRYPNNVIMHGTWNFVANDRIDECLITGTEGSLRFGIFGEPSIRIEDARGGETLPFKRLPHVQQPLIEKVVAYFRGEGPNPCSASDGAAIMHQIEECSRPRELAIS